MAPSGDSTSPQSYELHLRALLDAVTPIFKARASQVVTGKGTEVSGLEKSQLTVFQRFIEIHETLETLRDCLILVARPGRLLGSTHKYLQRVVESYLAEMFILKERLKAYRRHAQKAWSRFDGGAPKAWKHLERLISALDDIAETRHGHVHQFRFTDPTLLAVAQVELVLQHADRLSDRLEFEQLLKHEIQQARKYWKSTLHRNQVTVDGLIDLYFKQVNLIALDQSGALRPPSLESAKRSQRGRRQKVLPS